MSIYALIVHRAGTIVLCPMMSRRQEEQVERLVFEFQNEFVHAAVGCLIQCDASRRVQHRR